MPTAIAITRYQPVTAGQDGIDLPRVARDVRTVDLRVPDSGVGTGVHTPFTGVLGLDPTATDWPRPALTMVRLESVVSPAIRTAASSPDPTAAAASAETDASEPTDDGSPQTVRELLDRTRTTAAADPSVDDADDTGVDRSAASAAEPQRRSSRTVGEDDRSDRSPTLEETQRVATDPPTQRTASDAPTERPDPDPVRDPAVSNESPQSSTPDAPQHTEGAPDAEPIDRPAPAATTQLVERRTVSTDEADLTRPNNQESSTVDASTTRRDGSTDPSGTEPAAGDTGPDVDIPVRSVPAPSMRPLASPPDPAAPPVPDAVAESSDPTGQPAGRGTDRSRVDRQVIERHAGQEARQSDASDRDTSAVASPPRPTHRDASTDGPDLDDVVDLERFTDRIARELDKRARIERERRGR